MLPNRLLGLRHLTLGPAAGHRWKMMAWLAIAALGWAPPGRAAETPMHHEGEPDHPVLTEWSRPRPADLAKISRTRAAKISVSSFLSLEDPPEGDMPLDLAFTSDSEVAILNRDSSNVTFLDTATGTVNRSVAVGESPVDLAVTPDGRYLVTADLADDTVSVVDLATHTVKATVPVTGQQPFQIEVTADSRFAVVALINDAVASAFSVIDLDTLREVRTIPSAPQGNVGFWISPFSRASADIFTRFALTPDGRRIVLAVRSESRVVVYDRQTGAQLASIPTLPGPRDLDISSDGAFAIIPHGTGQDPGQITRIDLQQLRVDRRYSTPFPSHSQRVRIAPDRRTVLVTGYSESEGGRTAFIDLESGAVTSTVPSGVAEQIVLTADGKSAFLASTIPGYVLDLATQTLASNLPPPEAALYRAAASPTGRWVAAIDSKFGESVYLYDLSGQEATLLATALTGEIAESDSPVSVALSPDGTTAVVGHRISDNMAIVDVVAGSVRGLVDTGRDTRDVAFAGAWVLAANFGEDTLTVVDLATGQRLASLSMPDGPERILVAPDGRTAYVFTIRGQDQLYVVALDGAQSRIVANMPIVNRFGIGFGSSSTGVALSGDGQILAVCGGSPDVLQLIDTSTRQEIAQVPFGALPRRVVLARDHSKAWVSDLQNGVSVIRIGSNSASLQTVIPVAQPFDLHLDAAGAFVYALGVTNSQRAVYVIDAARDTLVATVGIPTATGFVDLGVNDTSDLAPGPNLLYVAGFDDQSPPRAVVTRLEAAGARTRIRDVTPVSGEPSELEVTDNGQLAVLTQTYLDGLDLALFDAAAATCTPGPARLCLNQSRFQVDVTWRTPQGLTGTGQALPLTEDSGAFWFFASSNLEMMVKVLNGCATNNRYWVFAAGLTNVEVTLKVTDRKTGTVRTYTNPPGTAFKPLQDTAAFATCP